MRERLYCEDNPCPNIQAKLFNGRLDWKNGELIWMHLESPSEVLRIGQVATEQVFEQLELWDEL